MAKFWFNLSWSNGMLEYWICSSLHHSNLHVCQRRTAISIAYTRESGSGA